MICPNCKAEIEKVIVYSQCYQIGYLDGNKIDNYSGVREVLETQGIECPECHEELIGELDE